MYGVIIGFMLLCFALVNLIGTWVITARAKAKAKRPKDAATMIAMRRILDNPKRAWAQCVRHCVGRVYRRHHVDLRILRIGRRGR